MWLINEEIRKKPRYWKISRVDDGAPGARVHPELISNIRNFRGNDLQENQHKEHIKCGFNWEESSFVSYGLWLCSLSVLNITAVSAQGLSGEALVQLLSRTDNNTLPSQFSFSNHKGLQTRENGTVL